MECVLKFGCPRIDKRCELNNFCEYHIDDILHQPAFGGTAMPMKRMCSYTGGMCERQDYCDNHEACYLRHRDRIMSDIQDKQPEVEQVSNKPRIPEFLDILEAARMIHNKKSEDYASASNPFSNFERSAELIKWFADSKDQAFIALIGTKLARLAELLTPGRQALNESVDDSFLDLTTYCALWAAYRKRYPINKQGPGND